MTTFHEYTKLGGQVVKSMNKLVLWPKLAVVSAMQYTKYTTSKTN